MVYYLTRSKTHSILPIQHRKYLHHLWSLDICSLPSSVPYEASQHQLQSLYPARSLAMVSTRTSSCITRTVLRRSHQLTQHRTHETKPGVQSRNMVSMSVMLALTRLIFLPITKYIERFQTNRTLTTPLTVYLVPQREVGSILAHLLPLTRGTHLCSELSSGSLLNNNVYINPTPTASFPQTQ